jgi:hypothetical protein
MEFEISKYLHIRESIFKDHLSIGMVTLSFIQASEGFSTQNVEP